MVPQVKLYLVGGYLMEKGTRKDIDIVGVMQQRDFDLAFGFTHQTLQEAYKERIRSEKLKNYIHSNNVCGWVLSCLFGEKVDFKWIPPSMLYKPNVELKIDLNILKYI